MSSRTFNFSVTAPQAGWFDNLAPGEWYSLGKVVTDLGLGTFSTISAPSVLQPATGGNLGDATAITTSWTSGCVDQVRKEFLLVANGGHNDYAGNEVYGLNLGATAPTWKRLCNSTPVIDTDGTRLIPQSYSEPPGTPGDYSPYGDGRFRSVHGWQKCVYANNHAWYAGVASWWNDVGSRRVWRWNRQHAQVAQTWEQSTPAYSRAASSGLWEKSTAGGIAGDGLGGTSYDWWTKGPGLFDPDTNTVWSLTGENNAFAQRVDVNPASPTFGQPDSTLYTFSGLGGVSGFPWAACAWGPSDRKIVAINTVDYEPNVGKTLAVINLDVPYSRSVVTCYYESSPGVYSVGLPPELRTDRGMEGWGAVYHKQARKIYLCNPYIGWDTNTPSKQYGIVQTDRQVIYVLDLTTWRWRKVVVPVASGHPVPTALNWYNVHGKFNIIDNLQNNEACLVLIMSISGPTHVIRLPDDGL